MRKYLSFLIIGLLFIASGASGQSFSHTQLSQRIITPANRENPFGSPIAVTILGYSGTAMEPFISRDNAFLFFNNSNDPGANTKLFYATRVNNSTFQFEGEVKGLNTSKLQAVASMDRDDNFYFITSRSYSENYSTIYRGTFSNGAVNNIEVVSGISRKQAGWLNMDAEISSDGRTLYYCDNRFDGGSVPKISNIKMAFRSGNGFTVASNSDDILKNINDGNLNYAPSISSDGRELFFTRLNPNNPGPRPQIYLATRTTESQPFDVPRVISAASGFVEAPSLSGDGKRLYFHKKTGDGFTIFMVTRD